MFSSYLPQVKQSGMMRDYCVQGRRLFVFDGVNPNIAADGYAPDDRIMGVFPQQDFDDPEIITGSGLTPGGKYTWVVKRVVKLGRLTVESSATVGTQVQLEYNTLTCGSNGANLATWQALTDGEFAWVIDGVTHEFTGITTAGASSLDDVADLVRDYIRDQTNNQNIEVEYDSENTRFVFSADKEVGYTEAVSGGSGTDISGGAYLNGLTGTGTIETATDLNCELGLDQYEFAPILNDSRVKVFYHIYRNKPTNLTTLYLVEELSQAEFCGDAPAWVDGTDYESGDGVLHGGTMYRCIQDHTASAASEPGAGGSWETYWRTVLISAATAWADSTAYIKLDTIKNGNIIFTCTLGHTSSGATEPGAGDDWEDYWVMLGSATYTDKLEDDKLPVYPYVDVGPEASEHENYVPPCRFARAWRGRIVSGGTAYHTEGWVSVEADTLARVKLHDSPPVRPTDIGAYLNIADDPFTYQITGVDQVENEWLLADEVSGAYPAVTDAWADGADYVVDDQVIHNDIVYTCILDHTAGSETEPGVGDNWAYCWEESGTSYCLFREEDQGYVTKPLPDNIEGFKTGAILYPNFQDAAVRGIAVSGGNCYFLRAGGVEVLEGSSEEDFSLSPLPESPPGCVSHSTIADDLDRCPALIYYAGKSGFVAIRGSGHKIISEDIRDLITDDVDHLWDAFTHGVFDPASGLYHAWLFRHGDVDDYGVRVPQLFLTYDMATGAWTAGELAASCSGLWTAADGAPMVVVGIAGGVARLADVPYDGVDIIGSATGGTANTLVDASASFPVSGSDTTGLCGLPVLITDPAGGNIQRRLVKSNTDTEITIYGAWTTAPAADWEYHVGNIRWYAETGELEFPESFELEKKYNRVVAMTEVDEYADWVAGSEYIAGQKVSHEIESPDTGNKTRALYKCILSHTSTTDDEPAAGTNWSTYWVGLPVNVKMTIRGVREDAADTALKTVDIRTTDKIDMGTPENGIRSRGAVVRLEGNGTENVALLGLGIESNPITKHRGR